MAKFVVITSKIPELIDTKFGVGDYVRGFPAYK